MRAPSRTLATACLAFFTLLCSASLPAQMPAPAFEPIATGRLGNVSTRDGDSAFDVFYYAAPNFAGQPSMTRFETRIAPDTSALSTTLKRDQRGSVRWSATVTPSKSGRFPLALRATGAATLRIDGKIAIKRDANATSIDTRTTGFANLQQGKPYEFAIEFPDTDAAGALALEWAPPTAAPKSAKSSKSAKSTPRAAPAETTAGPRPGETIGAETRIENANYAIVSRTDGTLAITEKRTGATAEFAPEFTVVFQPAGSETKMDISGVRYKDDGPGGPINYQIASWGKESDYYRAARPRVRLRAASVEVVKPGAANANAAPALRWTFPKQEKFTLIAEITVPADGSEPALACRLSAAGPGQVSIGYTGAPAVSIAKADWIWQPLVWTEKRFPNHAILTREFHCTIPFVMTGVDGNAIGVGADTGETPYRMPTGPTSRFGVLVRNADGHAQPQLFAPVLGGPESAVKAGDERAFTFRLAVRKGLWFDAYKHLATTLYGFTDERENVLCSLNTTLENLTDFVLNDRFCYWYPKYKTWGYQNDAGPNAGRQQSAADALSLALVLDNGEFLARRALPTLEYFFSRNKNQGDLDDPRMLGESFRYAIDLVAALRLTADRNGALRAKIEPVIAPVKMPAASATNFGQSNRALAQSLAAYRLTGNKAFLDNARIAADAYIQARMANPVETYKGNFSNFWPDVSPCYDNLYELYGETRDKRYLQAAAAAMRELTAFIYLAPQPRGNFTANPGGVYNGQPVPEETVPAWVVSANGLAAECAATSHSHRGIFMSVYYAGYMTRLGRDSREPFFTNIARDCVVGRYANYPSYAYRNGYTTLHQKPGYPLRTFEEIKKFTSAHYNHPLPMAAMLVDYLVSDIYARSNAAIDFPSEYTYSGAYFRNKVYGNRPGKFFADQDVWLWLPKGLVSTDSIQLNHLSARGNGKLYLAFSNQSATPVKATFAVSPQRVRLDGAHNARVWRDNKPADAIQVVDGRATIEVSPKGLTCVAIDDAVTNTEIQNAMLDPKVPALPENASTTVNTAFGKTTATAIRLGRGMTSVHVWIQGGPPAIKKAVLRCAAAGKNVEVKCDSYPFEFTVAVPDDAREFRCTVEATTAKGAQTSPQIVVPLGAPAK